MFKLIETRKSENNYTTGVPDIIAHFECDTESDLPAQNQTDYTLDANKAGLYVDAAWKNALTCSIDMGSKNVNIKNTIKTSIAPNFLLTIVPPKLIHKFLI